MGVSNQPSDAVHLLPMLECIEANTGQRPTALIADAGYCSSSNLEACEESGLNAYISTSRQQHGHRPRPSRGRPPRDLDAHGRMDRKLRSSNNDQQRGHSHKCTFYAGDSMAPLLKIIDKSCFNMKNNFFMFALFLGASLVTLIFASPAKAILYTLSGTMKASSGTTCNEGLTLGTFSGLIDVPTTPPTGNPYNGSFSFQRLAPATCTGLPGTFNLTNINVYIDEINAGGGRSAVFFAFDNPVNIPPNNVASTFNFQFITDVILGNP